MSTLTLTKARAAVNDRRIAWMRAQAQELRDSGDLDLWNLASSYERDADDLEEVTRRMRATEAA